MKHRIRKKYCNISQDQNFDFQSAVFLDCTFENVTAEGAVVDSIFVRCTFDNVDWYWCIGHGPTFIECSFKNCDLRGSFFSASFVGCRFKNCNTGTNNLGGKTEWEDSIATECILDGTQLPLTATDQRVDE